MEATAYSKINLFLKVVAKREDGYHKIVSLFLPLSTPSDYIKIEDSDKFALNSSDDALPKNEENLAGKAALLYGQICDIRPNWEIFIEKNIPIAAGMGGGSADAATVLKMLNDKYQKLSTENLAKLALDLGADVPFFLAPKPAIVQGIGEDISPLNFEVKNLPLVIVAPQFPVSAKWGYSNLEPSRISPIDENKFNDLIQALKEGNMENIAKNMHNDLEYALYDKFPLLTILRDFMEENGAIKAQITGSGPVIYGICSNNSAAASLKIKLQEFFNDSIKIHLTN